MERLCKIIKRLFWSRIFFHFFLSLSPPSLPLKKMAADDSVGSLYALYKPIWAAEEADRCTRWAAFLSELAGGGDGGDKGETEEEASTSTVPSSNPSALPLSASRQAAGLAALDALVQSWRRDDSDGSSDDDEPRREKLARLRALAQAGLPMVREKGSTGLVKRRRNFVSSANLFSLSALSFSSLSFSLSLSVHPRPALGLLPRGTGQKGPGRVREALRRRGGGRGGEEGEGCCCFYLFFLFRRHRRRRRHCRR